jgi:hypothetical protein
MKDTGDMGFRNIDVPYHSQWSSPLYGRQIVEEQADPCDDPYWRSSGFDDPNEYRFWARRICGLACLKSLLEFWNIGTHSHASLLSSAIASGSYVRHADDRVDGLLYAPFANWVGAEFGIRVQILGRHSLDELVSSVSDGAMAIASVSSEIRYPTASGTRQGGHLVLVTGTDDASVWIHNPSGATGTQENVAIARSAFQGFFANRGMVVHRPNPTNA